MDIHKSLNEFIHLEAFGGILLFIAAILALIVSNSGLHGIYEHIIRMPFSIRLGNVGLEKPLELWVNEGLMALFFFIIGLEIKKEMILGELNERSKIILPGITAIGGMVFPAVIYLLVTHGQYSQGWAIPTATDIAFSLGILSLFGNRIPLSLKLFLMSIAIFDDIGAILIIAFFYTISLSWFAIFGAICIIGIMGLLNYLKVKRISPYIVLGFILWCLVVKSGIHATLAGFVTALLIPLTSSYPEEQKSLEQLLHPWVAYFVLPVFAFFNSGIYFGHIDQNVWLHPVTIGILGGLFFGKQFGIMLSIWCAKKLRLASLPPGSSWGSLYGIALLCGVGFTMSLFIGSLAFSDSLQMSWVKLGVIMGSLFSGVLGYIVISRNCIKK